MASHKNILDDYPYLGKVKTKCVYCEGKIRYSIDGYTCCDWCDEDVHLVKQGNLVCSILSLEYDQELLDYCNFRLCVDCYLGDN